MKLFAPEKSLRAGLAPPALGSREPLSCISATGAPEGRKSSDQRHLSLLPGITQAHFPASRLASPRMEVCGTNECFSVRVSSWR